jgi:hypothetical protein
MTPAIYSLKLTPLLRTQFRVISTLVIVYWYSNKQGQFLPMSQILFTHLVRWHCVIVELRPATGPLSTYMTHKYGIWRNDNGITLHFSEKKKTYPYFTSSTTNPAWTTLGQNPAWRLGYTKFSCALSPIGIILLACYSNAVNISSSNRYLPLVKECRPNTRCRLQG